MKNAFPLSLIIIFGFSLLISCRHHTDSAIKIKKQVNKPLASKTEFEKVIENYKRLPEDSLKLKAANYLIKNLDGWFYYQGELLSHYQDYLKLIRKDQDHGEYFLNSLYELYGPFVNDQLVKKFDVKEVKSEEIIQNIDAAFRAWKEQPWGKYIAFNQFCEYILPFRIGDEIPEYKRELIYNQFNKVLDSVRRVKGDAVAAGIAVNKALSNPKWIFSLRTAFLPHYPASQIIKYRAGSCREMTDLAFYAMRATGIPVAIDFIPQWPYRNLGHEFNVLLDKNGKSIIFLGAEDSPGTPHKAGSKKGKVFRHIYAKNPNSLGYIKSSNDKVPAFLANPRLMDVTDQYVRTFDVKITLKVAQSSSDVPTKFAYICVFDNKKWQPIDWCLNQNGKAVFTKLEGDIVYIAGYFDGSKIIPASEPFILSKNGSISLLRTNNSLLNKSMYFNRIFPVTSDSYNNWHLFGSFQAANKPDFSDAKTLYNIEVKPFPFWNDVKIKENHKFRYIRFLSRQYSQMGELEFYGKGRKLNGTAFGSKIGWHKNNTFDKAFDKNLFTYFDSEGGATPAFVGMDFGKRQAIDRIRFSAPIQEDSKVKIVKGHNYQLFLWNQDKWTSVQEKIANDTIINFNNVPTHTLYFLHDNTQKVAERICTYENGKLIWW